MKDYEELIKKIEKDIMIALSTPSEIHRNYLEDEFEVSQIMNRVTNYAARIMSDDPQKGRGLLTLVAKVSPSPVDRGYNTGHRWGYYEVMAVEK